MEYKQWLDIRLLQISIENKGTFPPYFDPGKSRIGFSVSFFPRQVHDYD